MAALPAAAPAARRAIGAPIILVVDDEAAVREVVAEVLIQAGYRVAQAANGAAALSLLTAGLEPALLFTDIVMPGMDGFELAEAAQAARPGLRVLFTTGYTIRQPRAEMRVLRKPFRTAQLLAAVAGALGG